MGIKRVVDTSFWTDGKVDNFSPEDKLFMLYLLTNPFSTQLGIFEVSRRQAAFQLGYSEDTVKVLLDRFEKKHGIILYSEAKDSGTCEIAILNFLRHSIIKGGAPVRDLLIKELKQVKNKELIEKVFRHIKGYENLNATVQKIISEYEEKNGELRYCNEKDIHNDNENDNEVSYHDSYNDSFEDEPKPKKSKAEKEREAIVLKVCEMLGKHDYSMFSDGMEDLQNALVSFVEFRKGIKKPMTDKAIDLLIGKLKGMTPFIYTQIDILNQSIMNGWQGIFPLKIEAQTGGRQPYQKQTKADELNDFYNMAAQFGKG